MPVPGLVVGLSGPVLVHCHGASRRNNARGERHALTLAVAVPACEKLPTPFRRATQNPWRIV